jgi:Delta7-sterol 5-desaturase
MVFHWVNESYGLAGLYLMLSLFGVCLYAILAGGSYLVFFVLRRERHHPGYRPDPNELRRSVLWSLYSVSGNALLMLPIEVLILSGAGEIYFSVAEHGWPYLLGSIFAVLAIAETCIYWIHRALHTRFLYRHLHVFHHRFREPTPLASLAFHPLDSFAQALPYHLCALLLPLHVWVYNGFVTLVTIWAVMIHDRIRWTPLSFVNHAGCHTAHHWYFRYNYGQFFTFWDRLCGTYHSPADLPERFSASWPPRRAT